MRTNTFANAVLSCKRRQNMKNNRADALRFEQWLKAVDEQCWRRGGLAMSDMPDADYATMYGNGLTPKSAACYALRNAGE